MKDLIIDSLAVYGGYRLVKKLWNSHKDEVIRYATDYIIETIKNSIQDPENGLSINIELGGDNK